MIYLFIYLFIYLINTSLVDAFFILKNILYILLYKNFIIFFFPFLAPSRPRNLTAVRITNNSVKLRWLEPEHANGVIQGYNIYHLDVEPNHTERKKVLNPLQVMEHVLNSLSKYFLLSSSPFLPFTFFLS